MIIEKDGDVYQIWDEGQESNFGWLENKYSVWQFYPYDDHDRYDSKVLKFVARQLDSLNSTGKVAQDE